MGYDQKDLEARWQDWWEAEEIYRFDPEKLENVYSIDNPPRYASGGLHIGHATHYTHIDFAARYHRMHGNNVFFPLCFDVNGIPIEERVERKYGLTRKEIERHEFVKMCEEFAENNIGEMTRQFKILGESMDPSIFYQTNAEYYRRLTQISFIRLFDRGLVYKGERPINWCPRCMTAMADAEVEHRPRKTQLNYIHFSLDDGFPLVIATTRPELLATCQMIAISPDDDRADKLVGRKATTPIYNREVEIVADEKVDPNFGTGVVMICSIGDRDDLEWINKYDLNLEIAIDESGHMTDIVGYELEGMEVPRARIVMLDRLSSSGLIERAEDIEQNVGACWRCHHPMEFIVKPQWFLKTMPFKEQVMEAANDMRWFPEFMKIRLKDWVDSLQWDWVVSRQRYFATPIPLWECEECGEVVIAREDDCYVDPTIDTPPQAKCSCGGSLIGCEDVFDTWMDSSISPLYNTFWERDEKLFNALYPMSLRPQAHDIIRTWAFYTILRDTLLTGEKPFKDIMMDGFILSEDGTPMHASKGNVIDPIGVLEEHGADALRYYAANCALGEDNAFRMKDVTRGTRLCRKLFNVSSFIGNSLEGLEGAPERPSELRPTDHWILSEFDAVVSKATASCEEYRFDVAMREAEYFLWHQLADHYLELIKHRVRENDPAALYTLYTVGLGTVKLIAPFLPHITEECYQSWYKDHEGAKSVHVSSWPVELGFDADAAKKGEAVSQVAAAVRRWKSENGVALNQPVETAGIVSEIDLSDCISDITGPTSIQDLQFPSSDEIETKPTGAKPKFDLIGPEFRGDAGMIIGAIQSEDPVAIIGGRTIDVGGKEVVLKDYADIQVSTVYKGEAVDTEEEELVTVILTKNE